MKINGLKKTGLIFVALIFVSSCPVTPRAIVVIAAQTQKAPEKAESFAEIRESITRKLLEDFEPEEWRILGEPAAAGRIKDWSPGAISAEVEFCGSSLKRLAAAKTSTPAEKLDKEVLVSQLKYLEYFLGKERGELGNLQISVYPYDLIQYELQRFATGESNRARAADHFNAIEEILRKLPRYLSQQQANLIEGLELRKTDREILQSLIDRIGSPDDPNSIRGGLENLSQTLDSAKMQPLLSSAKRKTIQTLLGSVGKAYGEHANFLTKELLPKADNSWAIGDEKYRRRYALIYGNSVSLDGLVREAEAELNRINAEMVSLARELRPNLSLKETLEELRKEHFTTEEELLKGYEKAQKRIDDVITSQLGLPIGAAKYLPAPPGVPVSLATNWPAPLLSRGPGIVLVDTSQTGLEENNVLDIVWLAAHEGNPGHASQSVLFQNSFNGGSAPLCRFLNVPDEVGSVRGNWYAMANIEGWAFYTERLLLKSGLLTREERLAALTAQALRAARVVVDVRMHTGGWSRDDAAKYINEKAGIPISGAKGQAFRYSRIPLQALAYYFGARQFEELQKKYAARFGSKFYQKLLSLGPVPPRLIDDYFESLKP